MSGELVGSVYVRVRALTDQLDKDIADGVGGANTAKAGEKLGEEIGGDVEKGVKTATKDAVPNNIDDAIKKGGKKASPSATKAGDALGTRLSKAFSQAMKDDKVDKFLDKTSKKFSKIKLPIKPLLYGLAVPVIIKGLTLITQYVISLVGQLGFLATAAVGGGAAIAGAFGLAALAILPITLGFKARTKEFVTLQKKAKQLSFLMGDIGKLVQKQFMPGITDFVMSLFHLIAPFKIYAVQIGAILRVLFTRLSEIIVWAAKSGIINKIFGSSVEIFGSLADVAYNVVLVLVRFFSVVGPIAEEFAKSVLRITIGWKKFVNADNGNKLGATLLIFYARAVQIARAFGDLFKAIWNILKIGGDESGSFFNTFSYFAGYWKNFTESDKGKDRIREVFRGVNDIVHEVNGLFGDLIKLLFDDAVDGENDGSVVGFIKLLREKVIPYLHDRVIPAFQELKEPLGKLFTEFGKIIVQLDQLGTLDKVIAILDLFLSALNKILSIPGLGDFVASLGALAIVFSLISSLAAGPIKGFGLVAGAISGILGTVGGLLGADATIGGFFTAISFYAQLAGATVVGWFGPTGAVTTGLSAIGSFFGSVFGGIGTLLSGLAGVFAVIGTAILGFFGVVTAPVWVTVAVGIAAVVAAAAAIYAVFRNWKTIARWVDTAWDALYRFVTTIPQKLSSFKESAENALGAIGRFFQRIPGQVTGAASQLATAVSKLPGILYGWITDAASAAPGVVLGFIQSIIKGLLNLPFRILQALFSAAKNMTHFLGTAATTVAPLIGKFIASIINNLITLPLKILTALAKAGTALFDWILKAIPKIGYWLAYALGFIIASVVKVPLKIASLLISGGKALWSWIQDAAPAALRALGNFAVNVYTWVTGFVASLPGRFMALVENVWSWLKTAKTVGTIKLIEFAAAAYTWVTTFVTELPRRLMSLASGVWNWITDAVLQAANKFASLTLTAGAWAVQFVKDLPGALLDLAQSIWGWIDVAVDNAVDQLGKLYTVIKDWVKKLPGKLIKVIADTATGIGGGIIDGIKSGFDLVTPNNFDDLEVRYAFKPVHEASLPPMVMPKIPAFKRGGLAKSGGNGFIAKVADGGFDELILSMDPNLRNRNKSLVKQAGVLPDSGGDGGIFVETINVTDSQNGVNGALAIIRAVKTRQWLDGA